MATKTVSRPVGRGLGRGRGRRVAGVDECECPKCGHKVAHTRGIPCSTVKCPKCSTPMRGAFCI